MTELTITELLAILRECAGADETADLGQDVLDVTFTDLGYDSLATLQMTGRIECDYGIRLDEEAVSAADTPRAYLSLVNSQLSDAGV